ncbi:cysteine-rich secretory protein LCCL domain-containing 1b [Trichomycterus rosablanca]|uniref:cysteine-rich secretory protein LCCL domain-containing 1b n=1 Tax=Trichomycterus rosablanca TaxID=2290929 RepID=UPI002F3562AC
MMDVSQYWFSSFVLLLVYLQGCLTMFVPNATHLEAMLGKYMDKDDSWWASKPRGKRAISQSDMQLILDLHNKLRGQVYPPASNMEYMVWDTELERSAEDWAYTCLWQHGPSHLLTQIGQNLGAHWGRDRPPTFHVQAWYDEVQYFSYPYPQECNPHCPYRCSGPVCTHYTQLVWATSNKIGCAINVCYNMNVWGMIWAKAVYLVCNYSPPGNWWGHAPYKHGRPCSACPASYGGGCRDNLCYKDDGSQRYSEPEESNYIEPEPSHSQSSAPADYYFTPVPTTVPTSVPTQPAAPDNRGLEENDVSSTEQMSQQVECDTRLRDRCKGTTCNRYECPPGCLYGYGKVIGSGHYDMQSSICGAALHAGIIDNDGGWLDITRVGRRSRFSRSYRNGVQTQARNTSANAFTVSTVTVKAVSCEMTAAQFCPYRRPVRHCPRLYCHRNCLYDSNTRVIGTRYYSDSSSICRAALHAGVIQNHSGGYLDLMPVDRRQHYTGSYQNRISSESLQNPAGGRAFRVFAVI